MLMDNSLCRELSARAPLESRGGGVCPKTHPGPGHPIPVSIPEPRREERIYSEELSSRYPEFTTTSDLTLAEPLTLAPTCLRSWAPTPGPLQGPSS